MKTLLFILFTLNLSAQTIGIENDIPTDQDYHTEKYDSCRYVRVNELQELRQKLRDQIEEFKREIMIHVLARFCTFMSPEKAAIEAVRYSKALLKELEK